MSGIRRRILFALVQVPHGRHHFAGYSTSSQFFAELRHVADPWEEVRLTSSVAVKGREPAIPLALGRFRLLEVDDEGPIHAGETPNVGDGVILPTIDRSRYVVAWFSLQVRALVKVEPGSLDVVEFKSVLFHNAANTASLDP
jgi:hypothetical protein